MKGRTPSNERMHKEVFQERRVPRDAPDYPRRLLDLKRVPKTLFVRGAWPLSPSPKLAIVGSRRASQRGLLLAERVAFLAASAGATVISGGAMGIDAAAHRGALRGGTPTVVVMPTALSNPSPRVNQTLFRQILRAKGTWLTENNGPVARVAFLLRNRIVAALADWVVVVEAHARSGTRYTVDAARALGRGLAVFPWAVDEARGQGCLEFLDQGAHLLKGPSEVLGLLGLSSDASPVPGGLTCGAVADGQKVPPGDGVLPPRDPLDARILETLSGAPKSGEMLVRLLKIPVPVVFGRLTSLELSGQIKACPGGLFQRLV